MNIIQLIKSIKNPNEAKKMLLAQIQKRNPQIANVLQECMNKGDSPKDVLKNAIKNKQINRTHFNKFKDLYNTYGKFLPFKISQNEISDLEKEFNNAPSNKGFRF